MASFATISLACRVIFGPCSFPCQQTNISSLKKIDSAASWGKTYKCNIDTMIRGKRQKKEVVSGHQMPSVDSKGGLVPF